MQRIMQEEHIASSFWSLETNQIILSREVFFHRKSHGEWAQIQTLAIMDVRDKEEEKLELK